MQNHVMLVFMQHHFYSLKSPIGLQQTYADTTSLFTFNVTKNMPHLTHFILFSFISVTYILIVQCEKNQSFTLSMYSFICGYIN